MPRMRGARSRRERWLPRGTLLDSLRRVPVLFSGCLEGCVHRQQPRSIFSINAMADGSPIDIEFRNGATLEFPINNLQFTYYLDRGNPKCEELCHYLNQNKFSTGSINFDNDECYADITMHSECVNTETPKRGTSISMIPRLLIGTIVAPMTGRQQKIWKASPRS